MAYITKRENKWRVEIRRNGHPYASRTFATKGAAEAWARKTEAEMDAGRSGTIPDFTLLEIIDRYTEEVAKYRPIGRTKGDTLRTLRAKFGMLKLKEIDKELLVNYVRTRCEGGVSGVTVSVELSYMRSVLEVANNVWNIPFDLAIFDKARHTVAMMGISTKAKSRSRRVTDEELDALCRHFDNQPRSKEPYSAIIRFAVATTMRASEIIGMRWKDIDPVGKTVIIYNRKHPTEKQGNDQEVPLIGGSFEILAEQMPEGGSWDSDERIFPLADGTLSSVFPRAVQKLGLDDLRFHDLRHEGISRLFDAGFSIEQVSLMSGHRSWNMLKRYTHLSPQVMHHVAAERLGTPPRP